MLATPSGSSTPTAIDVAWLVVPQFPVPSGFVASVLLSADGPDVKTGPTLGVGVGTGVDVGAIVACDAVATGVAVGPVVGCVVGFGVCVAPAEADAVGSEVGVGVA